MKCGSLDNRETHIVFDLEPGLELAPEVLVGDLVVVNDLAGLDSGAKLLRASLCSCKLSVDVLLLIVFAQQLRHEHGLLHVPNCIVDVVGQEPSSGSSSLAGDLLGHRPF